MALDDRDRQEIKTIVAEEIHQVLRREMAHWWAESILALAGYPPHGEGVSDLQGPGSPSADGSAEPKTQLRTRAVRPRPVGRPRPPVPVSADGTGGRAGNGAAAGIQTGSTTDPAGVDYLTGVVESLLRTQESLAEQLQASIHHLETLLKGSEGQGRGKQEG